MTLLESITKPVPTAGTYVIWRQGDDSVFHWFRDSDTDALLNLTKELIATGVTFNVRRTKGE